MTSLTCHRVGRLVDARMEGLDESDRLVLEAHLQECAVCREHAGWLDAVGQVVEEGGVPALTAARRARTVSRVVTRTAARTQTPRVDDRRMWAAVAAIACVAVGLAAWNVLGTRQGPSPAAPVAPVA